MALHVNDIVIIVIDSVIYDEDNKKTSLTKNTVGKIVDIKWNMVLVEFKTGERDWIESRFTKKVETK